MLFIIILFVIFGICMIRPAFEQWSDMDYIKHLEEMGDYTDECGHELG